MKWWPRSRDREGRGRTFSSLAVYNYRCFFVGQTISVSGTWMQAVAQAWLVLQLTGSGTALGLITAARFLPTLLFGPWGGLMADRLDKRRLLFVTQTVAALCAFVLATVVWTGVVQLWMVFAIALALGCVNVFDNPARQVFIPEMVPNEELPNAITLNSVTVNVARVIGPSIAGVMIAGVGLAACFLANAFSFVAVLVSLAVMRVAALRPSTLEPRERGQVRAGFRYVARTPELLVPLLMIAVVGTLAWEFQVSLPLMAERAFHGDASTYGAFLAAMGVGAVVGGLLSASRSYTAGTALARTSIAWGVVILAAALAPTMGLEMIALLFVGSGSIAFNALSKTTLQLRAAPHMRGRVMALWSVAYLGSTPIGGPIIGWIGQNVGPRWTLVVGGVSCILVGLVAYPYLARARNGETTEPLVPVTRPTTVSIDPAPVAPAVALADEDARQPKSARRWRGAPAER
jgi:MFS family permease